MKSELQWYLALQEKAKRDPVFGQLMSEYRMRDAALLKILPALTEEQRDVIMNYIGVFISAYFRLLELQNGSQSSTG